MRIIFSPPSPRSYTSERNDFFLKSKVAKSLFVFQCLLYPACAGHGAISGHGEDASTTQSNSLHFLLTLLDLRAPFEEGCEISEPSCPFCPLSPCLPFSSSGMSPWTGEVWQEFDADPAALSSAQLNFPECVALLIQVRERAAGSACHRSVSLGSAKSGTGDGRGAAALLQCCSSPQQCSVEQLCLTWGTAGSHSSLSSLAPSFPAAAQLMSVFGPWGPSPAPGRLLPRCTMSGLYWLPCQNEQELAQASSFPRAVLIDDGFTGDIWNNIVQQNLSGTIKGIETC